MFSRRVVLKYKDLKALYLILFRDKMYSFPYLLLNTDGSNISAILRTKTSLWESISAVKSVEEWIQTT